MTATSGTTSSPVIRSLIPARIDRLPWSRFQEDVATPLSVVGKPAGAISPARGAKGPLPSAGD